MPEKDYYKILGVSPEASAEEIRKAYRRLAKKHHPDRHKGSKAAEARFKEITEAHQVLSDPQKRRQYDQLREAGMHGWGPQTGPGAGGGAYEDMFRNAAWTGKGINFEDLGGLGDIFGRMFGGAGRGASRAATQRGADAVSTITIPFETAARGGKVEVRIPREKPCPTCAGSGAAPGSRAETCPQCRGSGQVLSGQGAFSVARPCPRCFGRGKIIQKPCGVCRGSGTVEEPARVEVAIPRGVQDKQKIRLAGLGEPGVAGGAAGDLLLEVNVQPHARFRRKGRDIYSKARVGMADAALGTKVDVETMHGMVSVSVPAGTQPGQRLRVPGYGLETSDGRKGDHYVEVQVAIPRKLTAEQRRLLEELRRAPTAAR
jgi:molecular chaperone DnaJ